MDIDYKSQDAKFNKELCVKLPVGVSDFQKLIQGRYQFIDKSLFIKEIINDGAEVILITRPRRFGKTLNLSMLYHFLQMHSPHYSNLFKGLAIAEDVPFCQKYQNQYPVIFLSFKDIKQSNYSDAYGDIVTLIKQLYSNHRYLLEGDLLHIDEKNTFTSILNEKANLANIEGAIKQLSEYLTRKFNKPTIILIDEYDTPIQEAYLEGYYSKMIKLMRNILGKALKDNPYLAKAIITGITKVSQESMFSGLNNIEVYSLLREEYGQYFGFTEEEVRKLITETGKEVKLGAIKEWYNGYSVGRYVLYNPWSIINCLKQHGRLQAYWVHTSSNSLINKLLSNARPNIKRLFEKLLQGETVEQLLAENLAFPDIETQADALWSLLLHAGYLNMLSGELSSGQLMAKLAIPNKEVSFVYDKIVSNWFSTAIDLETYQSFIQSLANGDIETFKSKLAEYIIQSGSYFDFNANTSEQVFHVFILGLVVGLREHYYIHSNQKSGLGRCDVIFMPRDKQRKGILLEFKVAKTVKLLTEKAQEGLQQIKDKQYIETFKHHNISIVLAIGLAFCGQQVELAYEEMSLE